MTCWLMAQQKKTLSACTEVWSGGRVGDRRPRWEPRAWSRSGISNGTNAWWPLTMRRIQRKWPAFAQNPSLCGFWLVDLESLVWNLSVVMECLGPARGSAAYWHHAMLECICGCCIPGCYGLTLSKHYPMHILCRICSNCPALNMHIKLCHATPPVLLLAWRSQPESVPCAYVRM
jgi:hypothetical protein